MSEGNVMFYIKKLVPTQDIIFKCLQLLVTFGAVLMFYYIWAEIVARMKKVDKVSLGHVFFLSSLITVPCFLLFSGISNWYAAIGCAIKFKTLTARLWMKKVYVVLCLTIVVSGLYGIGYLHRMFLMPDNLKNRDYIVRQIKAANPKAESRNITYMNDKYIFSSLLDSSCTYRIEVIPFGKMFPENDR